MLRRELPPGHARALEPRLPTSSRQVNPRLSWRACPGYGQTGPYARRAGLRVSRRGDGRPAPPQRLPRRAAAARWASRSATRSPAMFARPGRPGRALRSATRSGGARPGRRRRDPRGVLRAARESLAPEYDRLGRRARAVGHAARRHRAVERLPVARRQVGGDRRERRTPSSRRLCEAIGRPELADRPALRDAPRPRRAPGRARRADRASGRRSATPPRSTGVLNAAGVVCGPVYSIADIFEDPHFARARHAARATTTPSSGRCVGARRRAEALGALRAPPAGPGRGRWASTTARSSAGCSASTTTSWPRLARRASFDAGRSRSATSGRATACRTRSVRSRRPARRAVRRAWPPPASRASRSASFVSPERVPQMAGAEEVVGGARPRDGVTFAGAGAQRARLRPRAGGRRRRGPLRLPVSDDVQRSATRARPRGRRWRVGRARSSSAPARTARRSTVTLAVAFGCPFEGRVDPARGVGWPSAWRTPGVDEIVLADTIGVGVPAPGARARGRRGCARRRRRRATSTTRATPATPTRSPRSRRARAARRVGRRHRRLPVRAAGHRQHRDRGPRLPAATGWARDRRRPRALIEVADWLAETLGKELPGQTYKAGTFGPWRPSGRRDDADRAPRS